MNRIELLRYRCPGWLFGLAITLIPVTALQADSGPLVDTWLLVSLERTTPDGKVTYPYGDAPRGYVTYAEDGRLRLQIAHEKRADVAWPADKPVRPEPLGYIAYFGRHTVDYEAGTVVHHLEESVFPDWPGRVLERGFRVEGDTMTLRRSDEKGSDRIVWRHDSAMPE